MTGKKISLWLFGLILIAFGAIQFVPSAPVIIPATLPVEQRAEHRVLGFEGISNFRDLGGYKTEYGRTVAWGKLYRSGTLATASRSDLAYLDQLNLTALIDFRSSLEKEEEPNVLPDPQHFELIEIAVLDDGNEAMISDIRARIDSGNFDGFDPDALMLEGNRQFATTFTPQFRQFIHTVVDAAGTPIAWHCSAGKDRTGFAAAILLRILGVPMPAVMDDYMASQQLAVEARSKDLFMLRLFVGEEAEEKMKILLGVDRTWLEAAFTAIDQKWGSFDNYVTHGLLLTPADVNALRTALLE
ncbi:MAG: tyrosine-protein phosphatase [Halioglobus sp.]